MLSKHADHFMFLMVHHSAHIKRTPKFSKTDEITQVSL